MALGITSGESSTAEKPSPTSTQAPSSKPGRLKREDRQEIERRLSAGESAESIADGTGFTRDTVNYVRRRMESRAAGGSSAANGMAGAVPRKAGGGLDAAMRALRGESAPGAGQDAPGSAPAEEKPLPEISPAELVATLEAALGITVEAVARTKSIDPERVRKLTRFSEGERKALDVLAPHAALYAPKVMAQAPLVCAFAFLGVFGFAVVTRAREVSALAKSDKAREVASS